MEISMPTKIVLGTIIAFAILLLLSSLIKEAAIYSSIGAGNIEMEKALINAKKLVESGCLGIKNKDVCVYAQLLLQRKEECEEGYLKCAEPSLLDGFSYSALKEIENAKVPSKSYAFIFSLKTTINFWKVFGGLKGEECVGECMRGFYLSFEESSIPIATTPFKITELLYKNKDLIDSECGSKEKCPLTYKCMHCYEIYQEKAIKEGKVREALTEMQKENCHNACFQVAKTLDNSLSSFESIIFP